MHSKDNHTSHRDQTKMYVNACYNFNAWIKCTSIVRNKLVIQYIKHKIYNFSLWPTVIMLIIGYHYSKSDICLFLMNYIKRFRLLSSIYNAVGNSCTSPRNTFLCLPSYSDLVDAVGTERLWHVAPFKKVEQWWCRGELCRPLPPHWMKVCLSDTSPD